MIGMMLAAAMLQAPPEPRLAPAHVGRFAVFADAASIAPDGDGVRMRAVQVAEPGFRAGETEYWGGWSWWRFDCAAGTADRLDFASLRVGGQEGPLTPDRAPPRPIAPDSDAEALARIACAAEAPSEGLTLEQAVAQGQAALAGR